MAQRSTEKRTTDRPPLVQVVGANVYRLRRGKIPPMSRGRLHELSGTGENTIEALERSANPAYKGKVSEPLLSTVDKLATALECEPADLLLWGEDTRRYLSGMSSANLRAVPGNGHSDPSKPRQSPFLASVDVRTT